MQANDQRRRDRGNIPIGMGFRNSRAPSFGLALHSQPRLGGPTSELRDADEKEKQDSQKVHTDTGAVANLDDMMVLE